MNDRLTSFWNSRWGAAASVLLLVVVYQWLAAPWVATVRDDLVYLHAARMFEQQRQADAAAALKQQQDAQRAQAAAAAAPAKPAGGK